MNLWTILVREFRILCRRRSNYATRIAFTGMALVAWALLFFSDASPGENLMLTATVVQVLFCFGTALALSDAIGSERRNRTLGLLMLIPLRPWEVLMGKLVGGASQFLLCLAATLPVLALPLLQGEVAMPDVVRQFASILGTAFLGMSAGLLASTIFRRAASSALAALTMLLGLYMGPYLALTLLASVGMDPTDHLDFYWMGPLILTLPGGPSELGSWPLNMGILAGICLALLLISLGLFRRAWKLDRQSRPSRKPSAGNRRPHAPLEDGVNPYRAMRRRRMAAGAYRIGTGLLLLSSITVHPHHLFFGRWDPDASLLISYLLGLVLYLLAYWRTCLNAVWPLHEDRQCGMLELILVSPLPARSIRAGLDCWPGFLWTLIALLLWNLALIRAGFLLDRGNRHDEFFAEFALPLHLGALLFIPLELFAIRAVGLWWTWRSGKSIGTTIALFFLHVVFPVPLFVVIALILSVLAILPFGPWIMHSPVVPSLVLWTLVRALLALSLLIWGRSNIRCMVRSGEGPPPAGF